MTRLVVLAQIACLVAAFDVPRFAPSFSTRTCARSDAPAMVAAKDVFGQYYEASPPAQKSISVLPPPVAKGAMAGVVAVTGAAGFLLTPSRRIAVNTVGGLITAGAGNVARKRLSAVRQKAAVPAVAALLAEGLSKVSRETLGAIATEYDVPKKEFEAHMGELYLTFLNACLNAPEVETSELSELLKLQQLLKLSSAQVGSQVNGAARQLYSRHRAYLEDSEPNDSKRLLTKFVFLAERILSADESPEGYRYESLRLQKLFSLTADEWRAMAEEAAVPFYEKALNSAVMEAKPVTAQQLEAVRASLGITTACAESMHSDIFGRSATAALSATGKFSVADQERFTATQALLGMSPAASSEVLLALTAPLYSKAFDEIMAELGAEADERVYAQLSGKLAVSQQELLLEVADARKVEDGALRAAAQKKLEEAAQFMRVQNVAEGLKGVQSLVAFCDRLVGFLAATDRVSDADAALSDIFGGLKGDLKQSELLALYRVLLLHFLEDLKIDADQATTLSRLRLVLGLSQTESDSIYQASAGPLFRSAVQKAIEGGSLDEAQKSEIQTAAADLDLPAAVTMGISLEVYSDELRACAGEGKVMNEEDADKLSKLRDFLGLEMESVQPVHEELCAPTYRDSVRQVMGTSGAIPDEYWDGLTTLRERLGLSEETARDLFAVEVTAKMKEYGSRAMEALQQKLDPQPKDGDDAAKGAMNIEASSLTTELFNLVDFAVASKAIFTAEDGSMTSGASLRGEFSDRALAELYKQFLVEAFSGKEASENAKIFESLDKVSLVLGLTAGEIKAVHNEVGSRIYRQYTSKALVKGPLGEEQANFLGSIKEALGMETALCDELITEQQLNRVSVLVDSMFEKDQVLAEDVRKMRDTALQLDVDLQEDLQVSSVKLERFFNVEIEDLLESGDLNTDELEELCESLHISEERATQMVSDLVKKRVSGGVLQAAASMRSGSHDSAVNELLSALKAAAVLDVQAECSVSASERSELYMLFQASRLTAAGDDVERASQLERLKTVLGIAVGAPA